MGQRRYSGNSRWHKNRIRQRRNVQGLDRKSRGPRMDGLCFEHVSFNADAVALHEILGIQERHFGIEGLGQGMGGRAFEGIAEIGGVHLAKDLGRKTVAVRGFIDAYR